MLGLGQWVEQCKSNNARISSIVSYRTRGNIILIEAATELERILY